MLDAIVRHVLTTPEGWAKLREALEQQGVTVNIGTINIYSDALRRDDRVEIKGPADDPEIVRVELHDQVWVTDQVIVEKQEAPAPAATLQGETVGVDEAKADVGEEEEEEEVETGPWLNSERAGYGWTRHRQHGDYIELAVRNLPRRGMLQDQFSCYVEEPNGVVTWVTPQVTVVGSAMAMYPFEDSPDPVDGDYYGGGQMGVAFKAPDLHRCENGITLFDCPRDMWCVGEREASRSYWAMLLETSSRSGTVALSANQFLMRQRVGLDQPQQRVAEQEWVLAGR